MAVPGAQGNDDELLWLCVGQHRQGQSTVGRESLTVSVAEPHRRRAVGPLDVETEVRTSALAHVRTQHQPPVVGQVAQEGEVGRGQLHFLGGPAPASVDLSSAAP